jgi:hypothetical protein
LFVSFFFGASTHYVVQIGFELMILLPRSSKWLELQVCVIVPTFKYCFWVDNFVKNIGNSWGEFEERIDEGMC